MSMKLRALIGATMRRQMYRSYTPLLNTYTLRQFSSEAGKESKSAANEAPKAESVDAPKEEENIGFFGRILRMIRNEVQNINEVAVKSNVQRSVKRRLLDRTVVPYSPPELEKGEEGPKERKFDEDGKEIIEEGEEEEAYTGSTDVMVTKDGRTVWRKRLDAAGEKITDNVLTRKAKRLSVQMENSDNPMVQRLVDIKYDLQDNVDDLREGYETSHNRVISGVRRVEDFVTSESEQAFALGELMKIDPNYSPMHLMEDLEQYMIPVLVSAVLRGDMPVVRSAMADQALDGVTALVKERVKKHHHLDDTIVGITSLEIAQYDIFNHEPIVSVWCVCQQVHCITDKDGKVVEGGPANVVPVYYAMVMKRDLYNPDFDWKIIDFKFQHMLALA